MAKAMALLKAYMTETIPPDGAFIVSAMFEPGTAYAIYEITAYRNVKDIFRTPDGVVFKTDGSRTHMLVEPAIYSKKYEEPVNREVGRSIPYRFDDMTIITTKKSEKLMIPKEPMMLYSSFTVVENASDSFSFLFHATQDVYVALKKFIADSLYNDCNITQHEAKKASETLLDTVKKFSVWKAQ
jgi:hypothetical protein